MGCQVNFKWEVPGEKVSYDDQYHRSSEELTDINDNCGNTKQPGGTIFGDDKAPLINGTMSIFLSYRLLLFTTLISNLVLFGFVLVTNDNPYVTPFNLTMREQACCYWTRHLPGWLNRITLLPCQACEWTQDRILKNLINYSKYYIIRTRQQIYCTALIHCRLCLIMVRAERLCVT